MDGRYSAGTNTPIRVIAMRKLDNKVVTVITMPGIMTKEDVHIAMNLGI